jgi:Uma2 family endonuclease
VEVESFGRLTKNSVEERKMVLPKFKTKISAEDYLEGEKNSPVKHEFVYGEVFAMAGTTDNHNRIAGNIYSRLLADLRDENCEPFIGDIKVRVNPLVYYYPDVLVSCEEPTDQHYRNEPILIVEVTSDSTREIDRREKMAFYLQIPSVQEYVIVEQKKMLVEIHRRQPDGRWLTHFYNRADEEFEFVSVDLKFTVSEIYRRVQFPQN